MRDNGHTTREVTMRDWKSAKSKNRKSAKSKNWKSGNGKSENEEARSGA